MAQYEIEQANINAYEIKNASSPDGGFVYGYCGAPGCKQKISIEVRTRDAGLSEQLGISVSSELCSNNHQNYIKRS